MFNDRLIKRIFLFLAAVFLVSATSKLIYLQVAQHKFYESFVNAQTDVKTSYFKDRGYIYDRNGVILAKNKKVSSVYIFGKDINDPNKLIADLKLNGVNITKDVEANIIAKKNFIWLIRHIDVSKADSIKKNIKEIRVVFEDSRLYPQGSTLASIIGSTGIDNQGLSGIEYFNDKILKGEKISATMIKDSRGEMILFDAGVLDTEPSSAVFLSIDLQLQGIVDSILLSDIANYKADVGIAIAMDIKTGDIVFASSVENRKNSVPKVITNKNLASTYLFEPGSTFKAITFGYLIEKGLFKPNAMVDTSKNYELPGHSIKDVYRYQSLSQSDVFRKSSNIGVAKLSENIKKNDFYKFITSVGFGSKLNIEGVSEENGIFRTVDKWSVYSLPTLSIGHELMVTPVQLLYYYSAIGNHGVAVKPRFISGTIIDNTYSSYRSIENRIISDKTAGILLDLFRGTVLYGTGKRANAAVVSIGGKTGTAQLVEQGKVGYSKTNYIASFAGIFPLESPRFVMIVIYENPKVSIFGGVSASETFSKIASQVAYKYNIGNNITRLSYASK